MGYDINKASQKLSGLEINIDSDNILINILWFRMMTNQGQWTISRHRHSSYEIHIIVSGSCKVILDDGEFEAGEGEFYITPPGVYHEQRGTGSKNHVEYCINCDFKVTDDSDSEGKHILDALSNAKCKPYKDVYGAAKMFAAALKEAYYSKLGYFANIKNLAFLIINSCARTAAKEKPAVYEVPKKKLKDDFRFKQIEQFVSDNISNTIQVRDIACYLYLSERQVYRIINSKTGLSAREYIINAKLEKAKNLLINTNLYIKEIAEKLGFSSEYYFSQFFKKQEGYPPGVFRNNVIMSENLKKQS